MPNFEIEQSIENRKNLQLQELINKIAIKIISSLKNNPLKNSIFKDVIYTLEKRFPGIAEKIELIIDNGISPFGEYSKLGLDGNNNYLSINELSILANYDKNKIKIAISNLKTTDKDKNILNLAKELKKLSKKNVMEGKIRNLFKK